MWIYRLKFNIPIFFNLLTIHLKTDMDIMSFQSLQFQIAYLGLDRV